MFGPDARKGRFNVSTFTGLVSRALCPWLPPTLPKSSHPWPFLCLPTEPPGLQSLLAPVWDFKITGTCHVLPHLGFCPVQSFHERSLSAHVLVSGPPSTSQPKLHFLLKASWNQCLILSFIYLLLFMRPFLHLFSSCLWNNLRVCVFST